MTSSRFHRAQRPVCALLVVALTASGCGALRVNEHHHPGGSAVSVRVVWRDGGQSRLVGGVSVVLHRVGPDHPRHVASATTGTDVSTLFDDLEPGRYRVTLSGRGMAMVERTFDVHPFRRMSVRVDVEALETRSASGAGSNVSSAIGEGALLVAKGLGIVLLVVAVVGIFVLIALADDDDDDDDCDRDRACRRRSHHHHDRVPCGP